MALRVRTVLNHPGCRDADEVRSRAYGEELREAVETSFPSWIRPVVEHRALGFNHDLALLDSVVESVLDELSSRLEVLIAADVDAQISGPLEMIRQSMGPTSTSTIWAYRTWNAILSTNALDLRTDGRSGR